MTNLTGLPTNPDSFLKSIKKSDFENQHTDDADHNKLSFIRILLQTRTSKQEHLVQHTETITSLAHTSDRLASCSGAHKLQPSQICIWNVETFQLLHTCNYHEHQVSQTFLSMIQHAIVSEHLVRFLQFLLCPFLKIIQTFLNQ